MTAYYNENNAYAASWLRNLIAAGHIADGEVDERDIWDVRPSDLEGYTQCHFFAGLGGWSYALRLAGWPDDRPVFTGSCPCQPFSKAGVGLGFDDERHLWPAWFWHISQCRPGVIFGEQVDAAAGRDWLDLVSADLEGVGYAVGSVVLPAASVGAPHGRHRLWFVADNRGPRLEVLGEQPAWGELAAPERSGALGGLGLTDDNGRVAGCEAITPLGQGRPAHATGSGPWGTVEWLACRDGKSRPTEPGLFPLAHGVPARVGRLRAYGNAIVPQCAAAVIRAYMDVRC